MDEKPVEPRVLIANHSKQVRPQMPLINLNGLEKQVCAHAAQVPRYQPR